MNSASIPQPTRALFSLACATLAAAPLHAGGGTTGTTERVSLTGDGGSISENCLYPAISDDGRFVAFATDEPLLAEDDNNRQDIYVQDRETGELVCASVNFWGFYVDSDASYPALSADGRCVVYEASGPGIGIDLNGNSDVIFIDLDEGVPRIVSTSFGGIAAANDASARPSLSADGRWVAFQSAADNVMAGGGDTNGTWDIYVHDMLTGNKSRASVGGLGEANGGSYAPTISDDGLRVAFHSAASNLVLWDTNGLQDVFVHRFDGGSTTLVSRSTAGTPGNAGSYQARISGTGQIVLFRSYASDLVPGDTNGMLDAFYTVVGQSEVHLVSESWAGLPADGATSFADISSDGQYVAFRSSATNLTAATSPGTDVYLRDLETGQNWLMSRPSGAAQVADLSSGSAAVSENGLHVAFLSDATNLDTDDENGVTDVYVRTTLDDPQAYCQTMTTVDGCVPSIDSLGIPSASQDHGFQVMATNVEPDKPALLFYGFQGRRALPFMGGTHCVKGSTKRSRLLRSTATGPGTCDGVLSIDMNAFAAGAIPGNPQPALSLVGQRVNAQFWGRDPGSTFGVFLTDAIEYVVGP